MEDNEQMKRTLFLAIGRSITERIQQRIRDNKITPPTLEKKKDPNAPDIMKLNKKGQQGTTLFDTGRLVRSIRPIVVGDSIYIGSNLVYARIHHLGGIINQKWTSKKTGKEIKRTIKIPARPYMFLDDADRSFIQQRIKLFMEKQLTKK